MSTSTRQLSIKAGVVTRSVLSLPSFSSSPSLNLSPALSTHRSPAHRLAKDVTGYRAEAEAQKAKVAQMDADSADEYELRAQVRSRSLSPSREPFCPRADRAPSRL